jgi:hypothetical protein
MVEALDLASAHGDGGIKPSSGAATNTSPTNKSWMVDASFLRPKLVRHLLKMA